MYVQPKRTGSYGGNGRSTHAMYNEMLELHLSEHHPLWTDPEVRRLGGSTTQLCFTQRPSAVSHKLTTPGATPRDLACGTYAMVPLFTATAADAEALDVASKMTDHDVMPPSSTTWALTPAESERYRQSMEQIRELGEALSAGEYSASDDHHCVAYTLSLNGLVHNPAAVSHFCKRIRDVAVTGTVDVHGVPELLTTDDGADAGQFVVVNVVVAI